MEVIGIVAISLDGCITRHDREGVSFTSAADKRYYRQVLRTFDCSILGSKTFEEAKADILQARTADRLRVVWTRHPDRYAQYAQEGALEFVAGDLADIVRELRASGRRRCAILGGTRVYTRCVQEGLLQELWVTLEPLGFGSGKRLFEGEVNFRFRLESVDHLSDDTLLLKYRV